MIYEELSKLATNLGTEVSDDVWEFCTRTKRGITTVEDEDKRLVSFACYIPLHPSAEIDINAGTFDFECIEKKDIDKWNGAEAALIVMICTIPSKRSHRYVRLALAEAMDRLDKTSCKRVYALAITPEVAKVLDSQSFWRVDEDDDSVLPALFRRDRM
jgi:hypothetical protein